MGIRESLLNTISSVSDSDFVRIVTAAGASSKATVANLFKSFESGLGSKDSLSNSDYIRVVGSDNEAYKQSVSSLGLGSALANGTDLNTLTLPANDRRIKIYYGENISAMTNAPSAITSAWPFCLVLIPIGQGGTYTKQILHIYSPATADVNNTYIRAQTYSGGLTIWTNWVKEPTRAEVEPVNITSSYFSDMAGCSIAEGTIYKMGKLITGNVVLKNADDSAFANDTDVILSINSAYRNSAAINSWCIFTSTQWAAQPYLGYMFDGGASFVVRPKNSGMKFCKASFNYVIA